MKTIHLPTMRLPRLASAPGRLLGWKESRLGENTISLLYCKDQIGRLKNEPELLALHSDPRGLSLLWVQWLVGRSSHQVSSSPQKPSSGEYAGVWDYEAQVLVAKPKRQDGVGNKDKTRCQGCGREDSTDPKESWNIWWWRSLGESS